MSLLITHLATNVPYMCAASPMVICLMRSSSSSLYWLNEVGRDSKAMAYDESLSVAWRWLAMGLRSHVLVAIFWSTMETLEEEEHASRRSTLQSRTCLKVQASAYSRLFSASSSVACSSNLRYRALWDREDGCASKTYVNLESLAIDRTTARCSWQSTIYHIQTVPYWRHI